MSVFKTFFRVIRKSLPSMMIYLVVFLGIAVITSRFYEPSSATDFKESNTAIAIIDRDGGSPLIEGLKSYLSQNNTLVELPDNSERLQDELFYRNVEYIAIVPSGFTKNFKAGTDAVIDKIIVPDSVSARYVDVLINKYLNSMRLYASYSNLTLEQQVQAVHDTLQKQTTVSMQTDVVNNTSKAYISYFGYLAYSLLALILLGISTIMMVYNQPDLRRRNLCSPLPQRSMNLQLALGSVIFAVFCWLIMILCSFFIYGKQLHVAGLLPYLALNSLAFTVVCVAIGFLVGLLIKSYNVQAAIANVLSLGMSFLCGVFVPQAIMSKTVLRFASFLPAYWYIKANNAIGTLTSFDTDNLTPIFIDMLIQLGFAVAIFSVALFINKQKRASNQ